MDSSIIYDSLWSTYSNSDYKMQNKFIFNWECDFFLMSKSGYAVELEVKVSRSDFFADFNKPKHNLFADVHSGKTHHIFKGNHYRIYGPYIDGFVWERTYQITERRITTRDENIDSTPSPVGTLIREIKKPKRIQEEYPAQFIRIKPVDQILLPNKFIYVTPVGLIAPNEVPIYAGLSYCTGSGNIKTVTKPPFIHKRCMVKELAPVLRDKFYYLSIEQRREIRMLQYELKRLKENINH